LELYDTVSGTLYKHALRMRAKQILSRASHARLLALFLHGHRSWMIASTTYL